MYKFRTLRDGAKTLQRSLPGRPPDRVELVISHHRPCCAGFTHGACNSQNLPLLRAAVDEVANKDHLSFWMPENTFDHGVVELA